MNISEPVEQLQLFYTKAVTQKVHYKVLWKKKKEVWEGMRFIKYGEGVEIRKSGDFTTRAGAEGFVKNLINHIPAFSGWYKIIEYK